MKWVEQPQKGASNCGDVVELASDSEDIWLKSEADAWFSRNDERFAAQDLSSRIDIKELSHFFEKTEASIGKVLEVGCSSGRVVEIVSHSLQAHGVGIDPSRRAIEAGNARLSARGANCKLQVGSATEIPSEDEEFDLVMAGFFLYVIPPNQLFRAISELDRVLRPGGFLAIRDFDHPHFLSVPYGHQPDSKVFKRRYHEIFVSSFHYSIVFSRSFSEESEGFSEDPNKRESFTILYKEPEAYLKLV